MTQISYKLGLINLDNFAIIASMSSGRVMTPVMQM